jgi:group I intron endonuclease
MTGIIYRATSPDGKVYIGQTTKKLAIRKAAHSFRAKKGDARTPFQIALLEHGFSAFLWEQIDSAENQDELDRKEKHWIAYYQADKPEHGYNQNDGGVHYTPSAETRQKMSKAVQKEKNHNFGKHFTDETRRKLSDVKKGENNPSAKLTEADVVQIKIALAAGETGVSLANKYGVTKFVISAIRLGKNWAWVQIPA